MHRSDPADDRPPVPAPSDAKVRAPQKRIAAPRFPKWTNDSSRRPSPSEQVHCGAIEIPRSSIQLEAMVGKQAKPQCKLELWATLARRNADLDAAMGAVPGANDHHRVAIIEDRRETTLAEIESRVADLRSRGDALTAAEVNRLIQLMKDERAIELALGVNLTTDGGVRPDGSKIVWTAEELAQVAAGLAAMPAAMVGDNPLLARIERHYVNPDHPDYFAAYDSAAKRIIIYDRISPTPAHATSNSAAAVISIPGSRNFADNVADDVDHELGHILQLQYPDLFASFAALGRWQRNVLDEQMKEKAQLPHPFIDSLHQEPNVWVIGKDGLRYQAHWQSRGEVIARDPMAVPDSARWNHALKSAEEFWAELISKAALHPEQVVRDMIDGPSEELAAAIRDRKANGVVESLRHKQQILRAELNIIRAVFRADDVAREAAAQLHIEGIPGTTIAQFLQSAQRLTTPLQIAGLRDWVLSSSRQVRPRHVRAGKPVAIHSPLTSR